MWIYVFKRDGDLKRFFDILASLVALILLAPLLLLVAVLVCCKLGSPLLFTQVRPGLYGKSFKMYKFRSMTSALDADGSLLPDDQRLTLFGRWLRSSSLDELPGLWSVFKGDMSLVGPRPLLMEYLPLYSPEQARRHDIKPGITGWAQVNGRNAISWEEKFKLDIWYVENMNVFLDFKILIKTLIKVIRREGVNSSLSETMPKFVGSE